MKSGDGRTAVFRFDASSAIGGGHAMRCLTFAEFLSRFGWQCIFVINQAAASAVPSLMASGMPVRTVQRLDDPAPFGEGTIVVLDHYGLDASFEQGLRRPGRIVMVFDDLCDRPHACDVLVDPTPGRRPDNYTRLVSTSTELLLGPSYALLSKVWRDLSKASRARLAEPRPVRNILVSMGATDPVDATSRVVRAVVASGLNVAVDVVLGAAAPHCAAVRKHLGPNMTLHVEPSSLPEIAARADMAIGAAGTSAFERALLGLPTLLIPIVANQRFISSAFQDAGAAQIVHPDKLDDARALGAEIARLAVDAPRRATMSKAAAAITDGRGAARLLAAVGGVVPNGEGRAVRLRLAEWDDASWLLALQCQPHTRRFARTRAVPAAAEHTAWMAATLANEDRLLFVVTVDGMPAGMLRIDRMNLGALVFEISIATDETFLRQGVGAAALALACRVAPGADFVGTVLPENKASLALFSAAGYRHEQGNRYRLNAS